MKQNIGKFVVAAAMVLAVSGVARAHDDDDDRKACRNSTLDGLYVFTASGFNIVAGVAQPKAIVELIDFHGDGNAHCPGGDGQHKRRRFRGARRVGPGRTRSTRTVPARSCLPALAPLGRL